MAEDRVPYGEPRAPTFEARIAEGYAGIKFNATTMRIQMDVDKLQWDQALELVHLRECRLRVVIVPATGSGMQLPLIRGDDGESGSDRSGGVGVGGDGVRLFAASVEARDVNNG